jgi:acetyl-CoA carboxylase biotin carboxyl carrier protein
LDAKELRDLIELISKSNFVTFELEREGFRLKLEKGGSGSFAAVAPTADPVFQPASGVAAPPPAPAAARAEPSPDVEAATGLVEMTSPIVGTFYRQPGPSAPPFVDVGSRVKKGQVLCIIEAMKLMNEIEAEIDAEVVNVLVANGQPVEFGEVLFRLRPTA